MAEEQVVQPTPQATTETTPQVVTPPVEAPKEEVPKENIISRATKKQETKPTETNPFGLTKEDYDKVQSDPTLSKFYKSMQSDYIKKTQEASELKKEAEKVREQFSTWTPERLQAEINKPDFIQSAQKVMSFNNPPNSGMSDEAYSTLTDKEKAQLNESLQRSRALEGQLWQMQQRQQDEILRQKYGNYAPDIVDNTIQKLVKGELKADRESIYKVLYHDENVQNAYELGKRDALQGLREKQQATSPEGFAATPLSEVPPKMEKESDRAYFKRLGERRLAEMKGLNK